MPTANTLEAVDYQSALSHIETLIKANNPYIWLISHEERRFLRALYDTVAQPQKRQMFIWSANLGIVPYDPLANSYRRCSGDFEKTQAPPIALDKIDNYQVPKEFKGAIFIMLDFHFAMVHPIPRQLRDLHQALIPMKKTILFMSPQLLHGPNASKGGIEPTLEKLVNIITYELPARDAIHSHVRSFLATLKRQNTGKTYTTKLDYTPEEVEKFVTALQGLTLIEIDSALTTCLIHLKQLSERKLLLVKKQIISRSDILEYISATPKLCDVGGLDLGKKYFDTYCDQFSEEAEKYGVEPLRGVLLTGVPGTGKSLLAKAIAALWNLPLLRLDVGKVMTGLVGGSEEKMRAVIGQVEAVAPCILWIDEIEKSLSGTKSSNFSDGGTLARVFGTLLTAMEERMQGVVTIATANDISALPPELIRRFNEVMFVDLPTPEERREIFEIHLRKRKRDITKLDLNMDDLIAATHLYTGAEIEKAVKEAIARAFRTHKKDVGQEELLGAVKDTKCIAKVMKEQIDAIRDWARDKARYASSLAAAAAAPGRQKVTTKGGKVVDLGESLEDLDEVEAKDRDLDIS